MAAMRRPATYWYCLPTQAHARKVLWTAVNPHSGKRRLDEVIPTALVRRQIENEMLIELCNNSTIQLIGSDNVDSLVGSPPAGIVFSEMARADPRAWALTRPILAENNGWMVMISTPTGQNHFHTFYEEAVKDPAWFAEQLPATKTNVFTPETLEIEKRELIREFGEDQGTSLFRSEYMVSFSAGLLGSYFGREMEKAEDEGRISHVAHDPRLQTHLSFDLGMSDSTSIIFYQLVGKEIHVIDYLEGSGVGLDWYARQIQKKDYTIGQVILPHDAAVRELGTGRSRMETLRSLGINGRIIPAQNIQDGINAVRTLLPSMWFDQRKCAHLVSALKNYRRIFDDKRKTYQDHPYHDWTSHPVDSLRYFCLGNIRNTVKQPITYSNAGIV